jgi:hypothetical protein
LVTLLTSQSLLWRKNVIGILFYSKESTFPFLLQDWHIGEQCRILTFWGPSYVKFTKL